MRRLQNNKTGRLKAVGMALLLGAWATSAAQQRTLFDFGWEFSLQPETGNWQQVDLPHDWDIGLAPQADAPMGNDGGYYPGGVGVYRKKFATPSGERVKLHFEGVYQRATVYVNGQEAARHAYGYTPFTADITPYLNRDKKQQNEVLVRVDNSQQPNCRWYTGSGIYRHVWLESQPDVCPYTICVTTPMVTADSASVCVRVAPTSDANTAQRRPDALEVAFEGGDFVPAGHLGSGLGATYTIRHPRLWSPGDPYLYRVKVRLKEQGRIVGEHTETFGIRSISFDAKQGFRLNGRPVKINGACVHHDDGVLGAMAFDAAEIRKVRLMKEAGFNLIRTSHNPPTRAFLDACDSLGMLVIDEAFDGWRTAKTKYDYSTLIDSCYQEDVTAMVLRDRNHPCIISWSIGNEVIERKDIRVVTTARKLKRVVEQWDDTRPVTEALCAWDSDWDIYDPHAEVLGVVGYNYMMHKHEGDHQRDPQRVMWQTESYPRDAFLNWQRTNSQPYIVGDIVWTGLDYLGESGIGRWYYEGETPGEHYQHKHFPWHGAYCGDVDLTGWRKPISHYRDLLWNAQPGDGQVYLAVKEPDGYHGSIKETRWSVWPTWESWNWPGWEGKPIEVEVYTKCRSVSLYLNDRLVGRQEVGEATGYKAMFTLPYEAGTLRAVADDRHEATLETAGQPARLRLTADRTQLSADGQDLSFITLEVVDAEGRVVPDAALPCQVSVGGRATLMAAASANLQDLEPTTTPRVTTWKGRALIVVRSQQRAGAARISVSTAQGLPQASINLKTK